METRARIGPDGHRTAERRSLAIHRLIASRLTPEELDQARQRVDGWLADGSVDRHWAERWRDLLAHPLAAVTERIAADDPTMAQLRQTSPFAGSLTNAERWRILREVR